MSAESVRQTMLIVFAIIAGLMFLLVRPGSTPETTAGRSGRPVSAAIQATAKTRVSPEQAALVAKHELAPGLTRETAIDTIGTRSLYWNDSGPDVWSENSRRYGTYNGSASLVGTPMTPEMVKASWGEPDATSENGLGWEYIYREPPDGEVHLQFNGGILPKDNQCIGVETFLSPQYFRKRFPAWTAAQCSLVAAGEIVLGMTKELVRFSWGEPTDVNRSVGSWGVHEQWVYRFSTSPYSATYMYFENGILTSWQD
jgi:hypothetical protein